MNLWILTEERPKKEVLKMIFEYFAKDQNCGFFGDSIRIIPLLNKDKTFSFTYEVIGFKCAKVDKVFIKTVSGSSSFTDFLVFYQENLPTVKDTPLYAIEETKTDDKESRNTGVYQRCSKFVFIQNYYPKTKLIMLYALQVGQKEKPTETYIFGTRMLLTLGVEILGKKLDPKIFKPFTSIEELRIAKANMRPAPAGNIPIAINIANDDWIQVSGRLFKSGDVIGVSTGFYVIDEFDNDITDKYLKKRNYSFGNKSFKKSINKIPLKGIMRRNISPGCTCAYRRSAIDIFLPLFFGKF